MVQLHALTRTSENIDAAVACFLTALARVAYPGEISGSGSLATEKSMNPDADSEDVE